MNIRIPSCLVLLAALAACGNGAQSTAPECARSDAEPVVAVQEAELEQACAIAPDEGLTIAFSPLPSGEDEEGCRAAAVFVAPNGFAAPRVDTVLIVGSARHVSASTAVRDYFFTDRLSNSTELAISNDTACAEAEVQVDGISCRVSASRDEDSQDCGPVSFEGTEMFASFRAGG